MLPEIVYITQLDTGTRIALPLTPEKVSDKREGNFISYNILNVGEVKIPNGEKLAQFSWDGILPGVSMLGMGIVSLFDWKPPRVMIGILDGWKKNRKKLRLLVTGTAITTTFISRTLPLPTNTSTGRNTAFPLCKRRTF